MAEGGPSPREQDLVALGRDAPSCFTQAGATLLSSQRWGIKVGRVGIPAIFSKRPVFQLGRPGSWVVLVVNIALPVFHLTVCSLVHLFTTMFHVEHPGPAK